MVGTGDVGEYVLIPGDPKRVELMAQHLHDSKRISENRQFVTVTGWFKEVKVSIVSSGIGVPATLIVVEELSRVGAKTLIRVGTTGGLQKTSMWETSWLPMPLFEQTVVLKLMPH